MLSILALFICSFVLFHQTNAEEQSLQEISLSDLPSIDNHKVINRKQWGGRPSINKLENLQHPINLVIISHTATKFCNTTEECSKTVSTIQSYHISAKHMFDIGYNFLIGGDGNIYVGRGWDAVNFHNKDSIDISFVGNFVFDRLNDKMIDAGKKLLHQGLELGKLTSKYKLLGHNQTMATLSPGPNVYSVIRQWAHFSFEDLHA